MFFMSYAQKLPFRERPASVRWLALVALLWLCPGPVGADLLFGNPEFAAGPAPWGLACGDLDGDGDLDLVVGNDVSDEVVVLLNRGDGLFAAPIVHHAGSHVRGVAIGYVDADGARDIVVANWDDSTITVMINTGSGGFTDSSSGAATHAVATAPLDVVLYDLNADSNLDIVVAGAGGSGGGGGVSVLLGDGLGGFAAAVTYGGTAGHRDR